MKPTTRPRRIVATSALVALVALIAMLGAVGCADRFNRNVTEAYLLANEAQSAESMAALFHEDGVLEGPDGRRIEGREAIEAYSRWQVAVGSRFEAEVVSSQDNEVLLGPLTDRSELLRRLGIESLEFEPGTSFRYEGGLIRSVKIAPMTEASAAEVADAIERFLVWARVNRPDAVDTLTDPMPTLDTSYAESWLTALQSWNDADGSSGAD